MDKQYVKIQDPPASGYNRFVFKRDAEQQPTGFLSYSANGTVTVIYLPRFFFFFFPTTTTTPDDLILYGLTAGYSCVRTLRNGRKLPAAAKRNENQHEWEGCSPQSK